MIEAEVVIQQSLRSPEEYYWDVVGVASQYLHETDKRNWIQGLLQEGYDEEFGHEVLREVIEAISDSGHPALEEDDHFYVFPKGTTWDQLAKQGFNC